MRFIATPLLALLLLSLDYAFAPAQTAGLGQGVELVDPDVLRVCADPHNMPFSNEKEEGFEQALAKLLAPKLGRKTVSYTYYPQGDELVQNTNPYYRSTYALVFKPGTGLDGIETIADPRLKSKKLGVVAGTPPATSMVLAGLMGHVKPYQLMVDTRVSNPAQKMIEDVAAGAIDAAAVWGPLAGFYAAKTQPPLTVVPLTKEKVGHMTYRITMGVRPSDQQWKRQLNKVISENQKEIDHLLQSYGVPLLNEQDKAITDSVVGNRQ